MRRAWQRGAQRWRSTSRDGRARPHELVDLDGHPGGAGAQLEVAHRPGDRVGDRRRAAPPGRRTTPGADPGDRVGVGGLLAPERQAHQREAVGEPGQHRAEPGVGDHRGRPREHRGVAHVAAELHAVGHVEVGGVEVVAEGDDAAHRRRGRARRPPAGAPGARPSAWCRARRRRAAGRRRRPGGRQPVVGPGRFEQRPDVAHVVGPVRATGGRATPGTSPSRWRTGRAARRRSRPAARPSSARTAASVSTEIGHPHRVQPAGVVEVGGVERVHERHDRHAGRLAGAQRGREHVVGDHEVDLARLGEHVAGQRGRVPLGEQRRGRRTGCRRPRSGAPATRCRWPARRGPRAASCVGQRDGRAARCRRRPR